MERLREQDPGRHAEIMGRFEEARHNAHEVFSQKAEYLLNRDTSKMSDQEKMAHAEMARLFEETMSLSDKLRANPSGEELWEIMRELRGKISALEPMLLEERNGEFYRLGLDLGYNRRESAQFAEYLNSVIDVTSMRNVYQGFRPGRTRRDGPGAQRENGR